MCKNIVFRIALPSKEKSRKTLKMLVFWGDQSLLKSVIVCQLQDRSKDLKTGKEQSFVGSTPTLSAMISGRSVHWGVKARVQAAFEDFLKRIQKVLFLVCHRAKATGCLSQTCGMVENIILEQPARHRGRNLWKERFRPLFCVGAENGGMSVSVKTT